MQYLLKEELHPNQNSMFCALYLNIINTFLKSRYDYHEANDIYCPRK